jgi:hypothetical protein
VLAAQQMRELAFHRGPVGAVVGPPGRVARAASGSGQSCLLQVDGDGPPGGAAGALVPERAELAGSAEAGHPTTVAGRDDRHLQAGRAGDLACVQVDTELLLGEVPCGAVGPATLVIAVMPRWARSASSAPVP